MIYYQSTTVSPKTKISFRYYFLLLIICHHNQLQYCHSFINTRNKSNNFGNISSSRQSARRIQSLTHHPQYHSESHTCHGIQNDTLYYPNHPPPIKNIKNSKTITDAHHTPTNNQRRKLFKSIASFVIVMPGISSNKPFQLDLAFANDETIEQSKIPSLPITKPTGRKPFAPLEALIPATRFKLSIEYAISLVNEYSLLIQQQQNQQQQQANGDKEQIRENNIRMELESLLLGQNTYMNPLSTPMILGTTCSNKNNNMNIQSQQIPNTQSGSKLYENTYKDKLKSLPLQDIPLALLTQAGDYRQYSLLKQRQRKLETKNPIRAAFNFYTKQLQFDTESYILTAPMEERKRLIRNDQLPDIQSVIVSDLDLRDLCRNQVLDAWDDVQAELNYQLKLLRMTKNNNVNDDDKERIGGEGGRSLVLMDVAELSILLKRVKKECDEWFAFIPDSDVKEAIDAVSLEMHSCSK